MKKAEVKNMVFTMRINSDTKIKLDQLVSNPNYKYNKSAFIQSLINAEYSKTFKQNDQ
jgi:hypothetical protein